MTLKRLAAVLLCIGMIFCLFGCKSKPEVKIESAADSTTEKSEINAEAPQKKGGKTVELSKNIKRQESKVKNPDSRFTNAAAGFSLELFKESYASGKNTLISPVSVLTAFAMVQNGAKGETYEQMKKALGGLEAQELNAYLGAYLKALNGDENLNFNFANSIWYRDENLTVENQFLQTNINYFDAQIFKSDFTSKQTVKDINSWVKKSTDGMIDKVIDKIDPNNAMYLINALTVDALWADPYWDNSVADEDFTAFNGKIQRAKLMHSAEYSYIKMKNATGFVKPYEGGKYGFAAFLPNENVKIDDFIKSLSGSDFVNAVKTAENRKVYASIPKFKTDFNIELNNVLMGMGMKKAFDPNQANFLNMAHCDQNIYISKVLHKTHIEVTQKGTKAGAVTMITMNASSAMPTEPPPEVFLTRPFVYAIVDLETGLPIFIGAQLEV